MLTRRGLLTMGLVALGATAAKAQPLGQGLASQFDDFPISFNDRNLVKPQFRRHLVKYDIAEHSGKISSIRATSSSISARRRHGHPLRRRRRPRRF